MKYLVTGGAGFIGSHVVDRLIADGHEVAALDNFSTGRKENLNPRAKFFQLDVRDYKSIRPIFDKQDGVFHLAAYPSVQFSIDNPIEAHEVNVTGTLNVLMAAKDAGIRRVVFSSSCGVYGDALVNPQSEELVPAPKTPYALHKYISEKYCQMFNSIYGLETVILRYFNVYGARMSDSGPYSGVIKIFLKQKAAGQPLTITGDGEQTRDFVHVSDIARANILAIQNPKVGRGEIINIGAGQSISVNQLAGLIGGEKKYLPTRIELRDSLADNRRAKELLNWEPKIKFKEGLAQLYKQQS